jgi:hypothetical protein
MLHVDFSVNKAGIFSCRGSLAYCEEDTLHLHVIIVKLSNVVTVGMSVLVVFLKVKSFLAFIVKFLSRSSVTGVSSLSGYLQPSPLHVTLALHKK